MCSKAHKVFSGMAQWAHSSAGAKFGLKMHLAVDGQQKVGNFALAPGSMHAVSRAEEVLKNFRGTIIGDKGTAQLHWPTGFRLRACN
ncbi:MAG: transposase [Puniceicoccales bacterium]|nr:transposase [Puniceicoccales bacterium]